MNIAYHAVPWMHRGSAAADFGLTYVAAVDCAIADAVPGGTYAYVRRAMLGQHGQVLSQTG